MVASTHQHLIIYTTYTYKDEPKGGKFQENKGRIVSPVTETMPH